MLVLKATSTLAVRVKLLKLFKGEAHILFDDQIGETILLEK